MRSITGPPGISEAKQFGNLIESFAGGIVAGPPQQSIGSSLTCFEQMRVAAADNKRKGGEFDRIAAPAGLEDHRVNVAFDVIHRDQRDPRGQRNGFGVSQAHQQRPRQARPGRCGDSVEPGPGQLARSSASRTTGTIARRCSRDASSGTTPPYFP